jgi:hypothetical protein
VSLMRRHYALHWRDSSCGLVWAWRDNSVGRRIFEAECSRFALARRLYSRSASTRKYSEATELERAGTLQLTRCTD